MHQFNRILRNLINLLLSLVSCAVFLIVSLFMVIANYLACEASFELLGYDRQPLYADKLVGPFFGAFLSKATLTHLYAMVVAVVVYLGIFLVMRIVYQIYHWTKERRIYLNQGDEQSAKVILGIIGWYLVDLAIIAVPLVYAVYWDIELFRFRSIAGAAGIDQALKATELASWSLQLEKNGSVWAWSLTQIGAWGYLAITALAALGMENAMRKTDENWEKLTGSLNETFGSRSQQEAAEAFYGYDQNGQPVYDPYTPIAYDVDGNPVEYEADPAVAASADRVHDGAANGYGHQAEEAEAPPRESRADLNVAAATHGAARAEASAEQPLWHPEAARSQEPAGSARQNASRATCTADGSTGGTGSGSRPEDNLLRDVIGGAHGEQVTLAAALVRPERYWVDPNTQEVWDADYHRLLFGEGAQRAA